MTQYVLCHILSIHFCFGHCFINQLHKDVTWQHLASTSLCMPSFLTLELLCHHYVGHLYKSIQFIFFYACTNQNMCRAALGQWDTEQNYCTKAANLPLQLWNSQSASNRNQSQVLYIETLLMESSHFMSGWSVWTTFMLQVTAIFSCQNWNYLWISSCLSCSQCLLTQHNSNAFRVHETFCNINSDQMIHSKKEGRTLNAWPGICWSSHTVCHLGRSWLKRTFKHQPEHLKQHFGASSRMKCMHWTNALCPL